MTLEQHEDDGPWYKQFWAWFVFTPLIIVVIASLSMVVLAFKTKDDTVSDDYYKIGKMINQQFTPENKAHELGITAELKFDLLSGEVLLSSSMPDDALFDDQSLLLQLSHPILADKDYFLTLKKYTENSWRADSDKLTQGRWYIRLSSLDESGNEFWRLKGEVTLMDSHTITLQ